MTLPKFKKYLDFVLLDKPVEVTERQSICRSFRRPAWKFKIVALAISGPKEEQPFLFALAVYNEVDRYRLTILSRWIGSVSADDNLEEEWVEARRLFFSPWVKQWLANHPEQLIGAGIAIGISSRSAANEFPFSKDNMVKVADSGNMPPALLGQSPQTKYQVIATEVGSEGGQQYQTIKTTG